MSELTRGEDVVSPVFEVLERNIITGRDNGGLVEASTQLNHNLSCAVIIDDFELSDVT